MNLARPALIIGVGNRDRGDDGVGPAVVDEIRRRGAPVRSTIREGDLTNLLLDWGPDDDVMIVDCVSAPGAVGTVRVFDDELGASGATSTHGMGVADCVQLAEVMGRLPRRLRVVGIAGRSFRYGPISPELSRVVPDITDEVLGLAAGPTSVPGSAPQSPVDTSTPPSAAEA